MLSGAGQLDTRIEIITPENIAFQYRVAGPFRRLPAYLLDVLIRVGFITIAGLILVFTLGLSGLPALGWGLICIIWFVLSWFYGGLFETFWNGQTPGKRIMRIRVVSVDGQPINGIQAVLRNILREVDALPLNMGLVGLLAAMMNDRFQRLGDFAAGTMVVVEEGHWLRGLTQLNEPEVVQLAAQLPVNFQAKRARPGVSAYVERRGSFAWGRRMEIARHLAEPLREKFGLSPKTNLDVLLCALYYRTFITERQDEEPAREGFSPFAEPKNPYGFLEQNSVSLTNRIHNVASR